MAFYTKKRVYVLGYKETVKGNKLRLFLDE